MMHIRSLGFKICALQCRKLYVMWSVETKPCCFEPPINQSKDVSGLWYLMYRCEAAWSKKLFSLSQTLKLLNSITSSTDISTISYFDYKTEPGTSSSSFTSKLQLLLSWSVCPVQYGDHRPYAAMTLLRAWRDRAEERASRRDFTSPNEVIQDELFDWLDDNEYAGEERNLPAISLLFGELIEKGLFSYDQYIQRIIARGETGLSFNEVSAALSPFSLLLLIGWIGAWFKTPELPPRHPSV